MSQSRYTTAQLGGTADEVEAAFYEALQRGDLDQLMACWADEDDVFCVHPGGPRQVGVVAIRAAFEALLTGGSLRRAMAQLQEVQRFELD